MKLNLIIDECVDLRIFKNLDSPEYNLIFISKEHSGITDYEVIELAEKFEAIIITEDKDFGEWVFSHHKKIGVIFLRFSASELAEIKTSLFKVIDKYQNKLLNYFTVITVNKLRMRNL